MIIKIFILLFIMLNINGCTTWKSQLRKEVKWIHEIIEYTPDIRYNDYLQSCEETLQRGAGDCEDFANLTAYWLDMKGYTTELFVGWYFNASSYAVGKHAWVRVIKDGIIWVVDTSGYKVIVKKEKSNFLTIHNYDPLRSLSKDFYKRHRLKIIEGK